MQRARKLLFCVFVVSYLIVCPLTILYTFGYLVSPDPEQRFIKTGLIDVATVPPGAFVYVNNRRYTRRTPTILRGLLPGSYRVRLTANTYQPWTRTVWVQAEKATVLDKILLLPLKPHAETVLANRFDELWPVPDTPFVLLKRGPTLRDIILYDWETSHAWPMLPIDDPRGEARILSHIMMRESPVVLFRVGSIDGERVIGVELTGAVQTTTDLTSLLLTKPLKIAWDPRNPQQVFALERSGSLHRLDTTHRVLYPNIVEGVRGVGLSHGMLYLIMNDAAFQQRELNGQHVEMLLDNYRGRLLFGSRGRFQIHVLTKDLILFLGERGELLTTSPPYRLVDEDVRGVEFDRRRERVLIWRKDKVGVVDVAVPQNAAPGVEQSLRFEWVFDQGRDLQQAFWVYGGSHVLFRDQHTVWLLELESPKDLAPVARRLLDVRAGTEVLYREASGTLYYLDQKSGKLMAWRLLPKQTLNRLLLPDQSSDDTQRPFPPP